jgi:hypothetical protein
MRPRRPPGPFALKAVVDCSVNGKTIAAEDRMRGIAVLVLLAAGCRRVPAVPVAATSTTIPSRDPEIVIPLLRRLPQPAEMKDVKAVLGKADIETGSGRCIFGYVLSDASKVWVNTGDCVRLGWITREVGGKDADLIFAGE